MAQICELKAFLIALMTVYELANSTNMQIFGAIATEVTMKMTKPSSLYCLKQM